MKSMNEEGADIILHGADRGMDVNIRLEYSATDHLTTNGAISQPLHTTATPKPTSTLPTLPVPNPTTSYWHTTHPNDLTNHRTTASLPTTATVAIIGSGLTAACAAHHLLASNITDILVLEARQLCSGATGRNGGHCQPLCYDQEPEVADFELRNFDYLEQLVSGGNDTRTGDKIDCEWTRFARGGCHAYYSDSLWEEVKAQINEMGASAPQLREHLTLIDDKAGLARLRLSSAAVGAVLQRKAASLHPYKLVTGLWREMLAGNDESDEKMKPRINIQTNTPVTGIERVSSDKSTQENGQGKGRVRWRLHTARGADVLAEHVLLATNAYTARLLPDVFEGLIVPVQGQMSALVPPPAAKASREKITLNHDYGFCGIMEQEAEEDDYLVQRPCFSEGSGECNGDGDGSRGIGRMGGEVGGGEYMFGGGRMANRQRAGVGVSDDSFVDERVRGYLRRMLPRLMDLGAGDAERKQAEERLPAKYAIVEAEGPQRDLTPVAEWTGIMGYSRDGHPWVGGLPVSSLQRDGESAGEGLWVSAGYTGHGMPNASLCGKYVGGLIAAAVKGEKDWREVEGRAVKGKEIPECYVLSKERIERARKMPEIWGAIAE